MERVGLGAKLVRIGEDANDVVPFPPVDDIEEEETTGVMIASCCCCCCCCCSERLKERTEEGLRSDCTTTYSGPPGRPQYFCRGCKNRWNEIIGGIMLWDFI